MTDEELTVAIGRFQIQGVHTAGGDSRLPECDRGVLDGWVPDAGWKFDLGEVREFMAIYKDEDSPLAMAVACLADRQWNAWVVDNHPEWPMAATDDVFFAAT